MIKKELIDVVYKTNICSTKKNVSLIISYIFNIIKENIILDKKFSYPGFGSFSVRRRKAREGRDPRTGNKIMINASKTIYFRPSKTFKREL